MSLAFEEKFTAIALDRSQIDVQGACRQLAVEQIVAQTLEQRRTKVEYTVFTLLNIDV